MCVVEACLLRYYLYAVWMCIHIQVIQHLFLCGWVRVFTSWQCICFNWTSILFSTFQDRAHPQSLNRSSIVLLGHFTCQYFIVWTSNLNSIRWLHCNFILFWLSKQTQTHLCCSSIWMMLKIQNVSVTSVWCLLSKILFNV